MKCKPPPINHVGLWDSSCFTLVDIIDNDSKIPFYDLVNNPKSTADYIEYDIFSFELQLFQKIRLPQVIESQRIMNELNHKTSLKCKRLDDFMGFSYDDYHVKEDDYECWNCNKSLVVGEVNVYDSKVMAGHKISLCNKCIKIWS